MMEAERRILEARRTRAESLDLGDLALSELPVSLGDLPCLKKLYLGMVGPNEAGEPKWDGDREPAEFMDLSPLACLAGLQSLDLAGTKVMNLTPLACLAGLQSLDLVGTGVTDLSPLLGLAGLQSLNLSGTEVTELLALSGLAGLQNLDVSSTGVTDLSPLLGLAGLQSLDLPSTRVTDLSPLLGLGGLQSLDLSTTEVTDLSPLSGLAGLRSLDLSSTGVTDLSPLSGLASLQSLYLSNTGVTDLSPLSGLASLQSLDLRRYNQKLWMRAKESRVAYPSCSEHVTPACPERKEAPPMLKVHDKRVGVEGAAMVSTLDELAREGARRMLAAAALEAEVAAYVEEHQAERDDQGHRLVVRNGKAQARKLTLGAGTVELQAPRIDDRRVDEAGRRQRFTSEILPPYMRRSPKVAEVLPILYLRGLSTGDFREALPVLLGEQASGLSPTTITRLTAAWEAEYHVFRESSLAERDYVYVWADGVHFRVRLEEDRLCTLVLIGVRPDGTKELLGVDDGYRESTESWASLLRRLKQRGMKAPVVAVGDGALGFWAAVRAVWPETREQRCWVHRLANVLDKLPKRLQPKAKEALHEIFYAPNRQHAEAGIGRFAQEYGAKYPKAVASLRQDEEKLLTFFDFPAEHWQHLRTTNVIESAFATVRLRQRVTKGAGSRIKALTMAYKLLDMAQQRWRRLNAPHLLPLVRAGVQFEDGVQQERHEEQDLSEGKKAA